MGTHAHDTYACVRCILSSYTIHMCTCMYVCVMMCSAGVVGMDYAASLFGVQLSDAFMLAKLLAKTRILNRLTYTNTHKQPFYIIT